MIWERVTKQNPCPICGRPDYCQFGDRAMKCTRVESAHPVQGVSDVGWYHFYSSERPDFLPSQQRKHMQSESIDAPALLAKMRRDTKFEHFGLCAKDLGVSARSLTDLGAAWSVKHSAWAFPMLNGLGAPIGIRLRNAEGFKWAIKGSRQGVFTSIPRIDTRLAYIPEGPTSTAALLSLGLFAVGRAAALCGFDMVRETLRRLSIYRVVIVADNDEMKKLGQREGRPGIEAAQKLQKELKMPSVIWIPPSPCKDVRDFVKRGGTRKMIESAVNQKVWKV